MDPSQAPAGSIRRDQSQPLVPGQDRDAVLVSFAILEPAREPSPFSVWPEEPVPPDHRGLQFLRKLPGKRTRPSVNARNEYTRA